jgi:hypothetical protein
MRDRRWPLFLVGALALHVFLRAFDLALLTAAGLR